MPVKEKNIYSQHLNKGLEYIRKGLQENEEKYLESALDHLNEAISLNPYDSLPHFNKGFVLYQLGKHEKAEGSFDESQNIEETIEGRFLQGSNKIKLGKLEEAKQILERSLELSSKQHHLREDIEKRYSEVKERLEEREEDKQELDKELEDLEKELEEI